MKFRSLLFATLCGLAVTTTFTACDDDDDNDDDYNWKEGSKIELPAYRGFVLNEGTYQKNNTSIAYFDAAKDTTTTLANDLFLIQNGMRLGDTGQDLIAYEGNLYVSVYGSSYIAKLNGSGVEQKRFEMDKLMGQPRYMAAEDGYLYVSTYGGYIAKFNANDLSFIDTVKVGKAPERLIIEDDKVYCANGSTSDGTSDNRLAIIDTKTFNKATFVTVANNPQMVVGDDNYIFVQAYGNDWVVTPIQQYDVRTNTVDSIGLGTLMAMEDDILYVAYSKTDWSTYITSNNFYSYNPATKQTSDLTAKITAAAPELASASLYGLSVNPYDETFYLTTTLYDNGNGTIYHFSKDWTLLDKINSWGQNPKAVVFLK